MYPFFFFSPFLVALGRTLAVAAAAAPLFPL